MLLETRNVSFSYGDRPALRDVSCAFEDRGLTVLLGPNGSGKTTLLRLLTGLEKPAEGDVLLNGQRIGAVKQSVRARTIAYVPQAPSLPFRFSAAETVRMGRYAHTGLLGVLSAEDLAAAQEAMRRTETDSLADRCITELSGGERRRVFLAQALAQGGRYLLLDEPVAGLDERHILSFMMLLRELAQTCGVVCVLHELELAARFADRLLVLREGHPVAAGAPLEILTPALLREVYGIDGTLFMRDGIPYVQKRLPE